MAPEELEHLFSFVGPNIAKRQLRLELGMQQFKNLSKKPVLHYGQLERNILENAFKCTRITRNC